jgi:signal transduction histidine kinase
VEGAESADLLLIDTAGHVRFRSGGLLASLAKPGGPEQTWRDALAQSFESDALPEELPASATCLTAVSRAGEPLRLLFFPLPENGDRGHVILVQAVAPPRDSQRLYTLGMLAAGAAHEMNNLLTLISGWLELVLADEPNPPACLPSGKAGGRREPLRKVADAVEQLGRLTTNLLDFARATTGHMKPLDLNQTVQQALDLVDYQLQKNNVKLTVEMSQEPLFVRGSEAELSQTLLNLVMNAWQAMPAGGALRIATGRDGDSVVLTVADSGCGIPKEMQRRICEPFFTTRQATGGTGLGLALCKEIVTRHGGELSLESSEGAGTAVTVRIPLLKETAAIAGQ